jgi:RNA polymerase-binding transcription factor DksA
VDEKAVGERLLRERADLEQTVRRIRERLAAPRRDGRARELDLARRMMFEARIVLIDEALKRLERGNFGRCGVCGKGIPDERLELVPETPYCGADAEREQARAS